MCKRRLDLLLERQEVLRPISKGIRRKLVPSSPRVFLGNESFLLVCLVRTVVRENVSGLTGSFEAPVVVPELKQAPLKVSSVVLSTQVQPVRGKSDSPLVRNGEQIVPNLTHIVGRDQKMYFYYEVYDPVAADNAPDVRTSLAFYRGKVKVFETPVVERLAIDAPSRKAAVFQLEVPAGSLPPGFYTCQINVIDSIAAKFAFPRLVFLQR